MTSINNCSVKVEDVDNMINLFGLNMSTEREDSKEEESSGKEPRLCQISSRAGEYQKETGSKAYCA